jgi:hypothetical protein
MNETTKWLKRQVLWQIHLPPPGYILRHSVNECRPSAVQADLLYLPHDTVGKRSINMP